MVRTIHRAGWILVDPWTTIQNGYVRVCNGLIEEVGQGHSSGGHVIDHGPGTIMPGFVNAHTHLELCALKGRALFDKGFRPWVKQLINLRDSEETENLLTGAKQGVKEIVESGTGVVGEISTLGITKDVLENSSMEGIWFKEYLGNNSIVKTVCDEKKGRFATSFAAHAPHTTAPELLINLKNAAQKNNLPFSIHVAESEDEIRFLSTGKGKWADFLTERGIDFSGWGLPVESPVKYLNRLGLFDKKTIAVHLIHSDKDDFEILLRYNVCVCLCLRSNYYLHQRLPDLSGMLDAGLKPCLGTDSLACVDSLNMFDETAFISNTFPLIPPSEILAMATINGAEALGVADRFGTLDPGKCSQLIYVPVNQSNKSSLLEAIVTADFKENCTVIT
ncbi:MAG: amidohydrolase family protein [Spirochaetales bacterium]|jgi:cytosine/adenosine deaminase-related metal-dependent hydrolase|nr:amidohydrolase family protein [Spirochaetales bacterium]